RALPFDEIGARPRQDVVEDHDRVGGGELGSPEPFAGGSGNPPGVPGADAGGGELGSPEPFAGGSGNPPGVPGVGADVARGAIRRSVSSTRIPPPPFRTSPALA